MLVNYRSIDGFLGYAVSPHFGGGHLDVAKGGGGEVINVIDADRFASRGGAWFNAPSHIDVLLGLSEVEIRQFDEAILSTDLASEIQSIGEFINVSIGEEDNAMEDLATEENDEEENA